MLDRNESGGFALLKLNQKSILYSNVLSIMRLGADTSPSVLSEALEALYPFMEKFFLFVALLMEKFLHRTYLDIFQVSPGHIEDVHVIL